MKTRRAKQQAPELPGKKRLRTELLALYSACMKNVHALQEEARLLYAHGHYARAFFLAATAYEEVGKGQIIADMFSGYVSDSEFKDAFRSHRLKFKYNARNAHIETEPELSVTLVYEDANTSDLERAREASLYTEHDASFAPLIPGDQITKDYADIMLKRLEQELHTIKHAEWLNQRVGSAGIFK